MVCLSKSVAVALLTASANAHMLMKSPVPYGKSSLNNSPLAADGSDFPCKQRSGVYDAEGAENVAAIGEPQTLSFTGSAVHGGGSCQVSLTTDLQPTKGSKWMVIKSIEGGCPASVAGNLPADPNGSGASTFQFTVPDGIAPGQYTMAWTWFNKIGNREMYMNCAPFTVTGAKKKRYAPAPQVSKRQSSFPDVFVANLAGINDCKTSETFDYVFPNPGADVQSAGTGPYQTLSCDAAGGNSAPQQPTAAADSGAGSTAAATSNGADSTATATNNGAGSVSSAQAATGGAPTFAGGNNGQYTQGQPTGASGNQGGGQGQPQTTGGPGVFAGGAASATSGNEVQPVTPTVQPAATPAATDSGDSSNSTGATSGTQSGSCSPEGTWFCTADGKSFQRCASGQWSVDMPLNGMTCTPGTSDTISMAAGKTKRHSHLRRMVRIGDSDLH